MGNRHTYMDCNSHGKHQQQPGFALNQLAHIAVTFPQCFNLSVVFSNYTYFPHSCQVTSREDLFFTFINSDNAIILTLHRVKVEMGG